MKKALSLILAFVLILSFGACSSKKEEQQPEVKTYQVAVPNDTTNEARALLLLEDLGLIKLKEGAGITATVLDIAENPYNLEFTEVEAAQLPNVLKDVDYAVINGNYAIPAGLKPVDALGLEGSASPYTNILAVKEGRENDPIILALAAALSSQRVKDYIEATYPDGAVVSTAELTNGFADIDYEQLKGQTVSCAASPSPHAEILQIAKEILAEKEITLNIVEYTDYVQPNNVVESGEIDANYFQHVPYLDDFNKENGTHIVSIAGIHCEPMGLFGGKQTSLDAIK